MSKDWAWENLIIIKMRGYLLIIFSAGFNLAIIFGSLSVSPVSF